MCGWLGVLLRPSTKYKPSIFAFLLLGLTIVWLPVPAVAQHEEQIQIVGDVTFSDGTLVAGAAVGATPICTQGRGGSSLSQGKTTRQDGVFFFLVDDFAPGCDRFRLTASKESDDWLPVTKVVQFQQGQTLLLTHLVLADRGGKLSIQVWDTTFSRFIYAQLDIKSKAAPGQVPFTTGVSTDGNQTPTVKLLPPGEYTAQVRQYACRSFIYFTSDVAPVPFEVKPAMQVDEMVRIDVRRIKDITRSVPAACDPDKPAPPVPSVTVGGGPSSYAATIWGRPDNGLEIALGPGPLITGIGEPPSLALGLRNVGSQPLFLMTDGHCRGDRFGTSAIHLTLTDSAGKSSDLEYFDPSQKGCTPPYAMVTIFLGPGVTTSILINLDNYRPETRDASSSRDAAMDWRKGGTFTLQAQMASGTHNKDHWEGQGTAVSNPFEIHIPAQ